MGNGCCNERYTRIEGEPPMIRSDVKHRLDEETCASLSRQRKALAALTDLVDLEDDRGSEAYEAAWAWAREIVGKAA